MLRFQVRILAVVLALTSSTSWTLAGGQSLLDGTCNDNSWNCFINAKISGTFFVTFVSEPNPAPCAETEGIPPQCLSEFNAAYIAAVRASIEAKVEADKNSGAAYSRVCDAPGRDCACVCKLTASGAAKPSVWEGLDADAIQVSYSCTYQLENEEGQLVDITVTPTVNCTYSNVRYRITSDFAVKPGGYVGKCGTLPVVDCN